MDNDNPPQPPQATAAWLKWARLFLLVAIGGAGFLAWESFRNGAVAGCGAGSGCNEVLQSRWAYWLGLPVSVPALLVYLGLMASTVLLQKNTSPDDQRGSWAAIIVLSVAILCSAVWFVGLQLVVIKSVCKYCLTAHICGCAAALLCLKNIPFATEPDTPMWRTGSGKRGVPPQALFALVLIGLAGVTVVAGGQVLVKTPRNVVREVKNTVAATGTNQVSRAQALPAEIVPSSPHAQLTGRRTLSLYNQEFVLKLDEVPMLGSPDAPNVIVCLGDYTCSHCRALHPILLQMSQQFSNQLGIVCLPVSLSPRCNEYIPATSKANPESCEYARMALAVWRIKPEVFHQFDNWLYADSRVPSVDDAQAYAEQLVGADKLHAALNDPSLDEQIHRYIKIHRANWLAADNSAMPQIVMGDAVSSGDIDSVENLQLLLGKYLGIHLTAKGN